MVNSQRLSGSILALVTILANLPACAMKPVDNCPSPHIASCETVEKMLDHIKNKLHLANENIEKNNFALSIENSKNGINMLGKSYFSAGLIDDTGMKFSLAKMEEEKNNLEIAATLYMRVLESRITLFELKRASNKSP